MLLPPKDAGLFFKLHRSLMCFVNQRLGIVPDVADPSEFSGLPLETRFKVREAFLENVGLIESFAEENPSGLREDELEIVLSWRHHVTGRFFVFRQLKKYMVFLSSGDPAVAYGVLALTEPFEDVVGPRLPIMVDAMLLPFRDCIIYDGLLGGYNVSFGGGVKGSLNNTYREAKERLGIVATLPIGSTPPAPKRMPKKTRPKAARTASEEVRVKLDVVVGMTDQFCRDHLNDEYLILCRKLAEKLARKRPSPLLRGKPVSWACGIVRTIGSVNFLDDSSQSPHMRLTAIDKAFGVGQSTGHAKSREIHDTLTIRPFDPDWWLPSRMDDNPMVWMLEVNGFVMDIRTCPRELQEVAFEKGLIPYIPADREEEG
jgi:hypothetical protein